MNELSYNWDSAFQVAQRDRVEPAIPGDSVSLASFSTDDVESIIAMREGENDGDSWIGAFGLKDGRFVFVSAWCDYSGWG